MSCIHCTPDRPGKLVHVSKDGCCIYCDMPVGQSQPIDNSKWDQYYLTICNAVATKSHCLSRQIGAILVKDKSIISTGFNGPARGIPHCGSQRLGFDKVLQEEFVEKGFPISYPQPNTCPRKILNYYSGEGMQWCTAQHAEENCISNAARNGTITLGSTIYLNTVIPCKNCFSTLINAGIIEVVCCELSNYDQYSKYVIEYSNIKIRKFEV